MKMIPATPHSTNSNAERKVFDRLRLALNNDSSLVGYHSLNLTHHEKKRFGEIDFLIVGKPGLLVLEIKGGGVTHNNGAWQYIDAQGVSHPSPEGPFKQAESALHALITKMKLEGSLPQHTIKTMTQGFGVIFPDCYFPLKSAEWDPQMVLDASKFNNMDKWLKELFSYWRVQRHALKKTDLSDDDLAKIQKFLRPNFESMIPLHITLDQIETQVARMTDEQMRFLDVLVENDRVLCNGGAGTGKTFLAVELARRWTAEGKLVLLTCRSPWLKSYLESKFKMANLAIASPADAQVALSRKDRENCDALIVDEGQDLMDMRSLDYLEPLLAGGFAKGRWCIFIDSNNQAGLFSLIEPEALHYLQSFQPAKIPLTVNCRNTLTILNTVQNTLKADMGVRGTGVGPKVRQCEATNNEQSAKLLEHELKYLSNGGLSDAQITIISPYPFDQSSASHMSRKYLERIIKLDEFSMRHFPSDKISFSEIACFKGLENEAVIVVDLPKPSSSEEHKVLHYVAMSRPRSLLSMITRA